MSFVHLHTHSHYSLLDGLAKIDDLVNRAKELEMTALALTDHGVLSGAIEFYQKCREAKIQPIIGMEAYVAPFGRLQKRTRIDEKRYHLTLLATTYEGYKNLLQLTTSAHLEGFYYKPRIDWELLERYHDGLIALSGCLHGELAEATLSDDKEKAIALAQKYSTLFGDKRYYLEVQPHPNLPDQVKLNTALFALGKELAIPVVATQDIHYIRPDDAEAHDVLLCLQTKKQKADTRRLSMLGEDYSFRSEKEMAAFFPDHPEAIQNTAQIAELCSLEIPLGKVTLPHFEVPGGKSTEEYLKELSYAGLVKRYGGTNVKKEILDRLEYELGVIEKTGFASYFLIVQDFVNWAKSQNIIVGPGRGSAAGSLVSYLLNITSLDPLQYELVFERFLNPERISMPDIDLDFADTRRDEVLRYVEEKYGRDHVAQIITFGTMAARAVVRDVGRVLGLSYTYCDRIAKFIPQFSSLNDAMTTVPELQHMMRDDVDAQRLVGIAKKMEGVARHASTHACGVVITPSPLVDYAPLQRASSSDETIVSQYSLHAVEDLGLLKMDFLGLTNLTLIETALEIIEKVYGKKIDIEHIPLDDEKTFKLFQDGNTTGVFQLESSGMKRYLKQLKPTHLEDIIAMVSLFRPGPMELIPDYILGKHGKKKMHYLHPKLKPILEKTYGVAVYQEQVLQIARDLAGFTLGEADVLRKAVGKKISRLLREQKKKFIEGCIANNIDKATAEKIFDFIEPFAGYGFNRAHAACYALIAYETAYLKANYPSEFMAALLTSEQGDIDRIAELVRECRDMGITVLPPHINESYSIFTVVREASTPTIRFGLFAIKNLGENVVKAIIRERKERGSFATLSDFLRRVEGEYINKKSLESLVKSGALDVLAERKTMLESMERMLAYHRDLLASATRQQSSLFGDGARATLHLPSVAPATQKEKLEWEKEILGLYLSEHPLDRFRSVLTSVTPIANLENATNGTSTCTIAGVIQKMKRILTKNGEQMLFVTLEDLSRAMEVIVFPRVLALSRDLWQEGALLLVEGKVSTKDGEFKFICEHVRNLEEETPKAEGVNDDAFVIRFPEQAFSAERRDQLKQLLLASPGATPVHLAIRSGDGEKRIETPFRIQMNDALRRAIDELLKAS